MTWLFAVLALQLACVTFQLWLAGSYELHIAHLLAIFDIIGGTAITLVGLLYITQIRKELKAVIQ